MIDVEEETEEPEMVIEPWMTNIDGFKQINQACNEQPTTIWFLIEEEEAPIPVQGWMTDLSYHKYDQIQGKGFNSDLINTTTYKLR